MDSADRNSDLIVAESISFHWTARFLDAQIAGPLAENAVSALGCSISSIVLRAFAVELALKALYAKETGLKPRWWHNLSCLFSVLESSTQSSLDKRFKRIRRTKNSYAGETDSLSTVLDEHKNDFENWRYPHDQKGQLHTKPLVLNSVIEAVWEEYQHRSSQ